MKNKALVIINLQNDITKNHKEIIETVNRTDRPGKHRRSESRTRLFEYGIYNTMQ